MSRHAPHWPAITTRVLAGIFGSYAFTWAFAAAGMAALISMGVEFHDAEASVLMVALLVFLGLFLWSFAAVSATRVWLVLAGGAAALSGLAWALQRALLS